MQEACNKSCEVVFLPYYGEFCWSGSSGTSGPSFIGVQQSDNLDHGVSNDHYHKGAAVFAQLWPALVQCFVIIASGYVAGRMHVLSAAQAQGLGTYLSNFALPALLFRSLALMQLSAVNWLFLVVILAAKAAVFLVVLVLSLLVTRPLHPGKAGIYSIFATQSNDIALGYPIVYALYGSSVEVSYLYLVQPVSLVILNPLGVACMELQRHRRLPVSQRSSSGKAALAVLRGIVTNPIVLMSALGVVANRALHQDLPKPVDGILKTLGDSFSGVALFFLGHSMVGKISSLTARTALTATLLIAAKMLLLPLLAREICTLLLQASGARDVTELSSFAFFYGTFPTAPVVFLFATQYRTAQDVVAAGVVIGTFIALPFMFVSAVMVMLRVSREMDYAKLLSNTAFDVSWLTVLAAVWVLLVLVVGRRMRSVPHVFTMCLAASQMVCVVALMMLARLHTHTLWLRLALLCVHTAASLACHSWVTVLAVSTCMLRVRGLCHVLRHRSLFILCGIGAPLVAVGILLMTLHTRWSLEEGVLAWPHTTAQVVVVSVYVGVCFTLSVAALVRQHRHDRSYMGARSRLTSESQPESDEAVYSGSGAEAAARSVDSAAEGGESEGRRPRRVRVRAARRACDDCTGCDTAPSGTAIEDLADLCSYESNGVPPADRHLGNPQDPAQLSPAGDQPSELPSDRPEATERTPLLNGGSELVQYTQLQSLQSVEAELCDYCTYPQECHMTAYMERRLYDMDEEEREMAASRDEHQVLRHVVLVILMLTVQLAVLFLALWRAARESLTGLYIELEFINVVLIAGQGVFLLGLFGFDSEIKIYPLFRRVREQLWRGEVQLGQLSEQDAALSAAFTTHHLKTARAQLNACHWRGIRRYRCAFAGWEFVDWLIEAGVRADRESAREYADALLRGRVIEHVTRHHFFHDLPYLYRFVTQC